MITLVDLRAASAIQITARISPRRRTARFIALLSQRGCGMGVSIDNNSRRLHVCSTLLLTAGLMRSKCWICAGGRVANSAGNAKLHNGNRTGGLWDGWSGT
jgi:hypothetical protein